MSKNSKRAYFIWSNSLNNMHLTSKYFHQRGQVFHRNFPSPPLIWSRRLCQRPSQVELKQEELEDVLLMDDNDDEHAPLTEHFGQMALDSEGHLR
jgi:hypothetical protein